VASAYGWVTIEILSMVKRAHPLYSNKKLINQLRYLLARDDQLGHKSLSEMEKELVAQRNISGKVRNRSRILATWHACVT
jgi:hypothetical protein